MIKLDNRLYNTLSAVRLIPVLREELKYNHGEKLRFWLDEDRFMLFRNRISVDNYVALDIQRGRNQFLPFSMCRESHSDNYTGREGSYYLTLDEAKALVEAMEIIRHKVEEI